MKIIYEGLLCDCVLKNKRIILCPKNDCKYAIELLSDARKFDI